MRILHEIAIFKTVKSKVIISLFETVRLSVSISLRNLYKSLNSMKENPILKGHMINRILHSWSFHMKIMKLAEALLITIM